MKKFVIPNIQDENSVTKTIRIKRKLADTLDNLANKNNITVNRLINECIQYALENMDETYCENKEKIEI